MVLPFYSQLMTLAEAQQATQSSDNCWRTLRAFACLVQHSIAGTIETAAQLRINRDPRSNLPVYSSAPWNTDLFAGFVEALKKEQSKRNTLLDGTKKARHLIHSGEVMSGFSILATTIQKSQNEMEKRSYTGRTMTGSSSSSSSQVVMHPKPEDVMDINTYPNTCQWAREPQIFPNPNVRTIKDCYDDWHHGCGGGPPIKLLEQKYKFNWRKQMSKIAKVVSIYKNIADACDKTSVKEVQQELDAYFDGIPVERLRNMTRIRDFNEKVLVPAQPGYAAKRAAASLVRRKGLQKAAAKRAKLALTATAVSSSSSDGVAAVGHHADS